MRDTVEMLKGERGARVLLAVVAQSSLGTGAAYVALLLVAYDRFDSAWAISLVLLAEFVPAMLLGPLCGAAADRWPRRRCVVIADLIRAGAFVGVAVAGSFGLTVAFAVLAGAGTALFRPSMLAALPGLVRPERLPAATSAYGAVTDVGFTLGPAIAAPLLVVASPENVLIANGATFLISAAVLGRLQFGQAPAANEAYPAESLLGQAREGLRAVSGMRAVAVLIALTGGSMLSGGIFNVIELPFATDALGIGGSGYAALVAVYGLGFLGGSLAGAGGGAAPLLKRRFLQGLVLTGLGGVIAAVAPGLVIGTLAFAIGGFGNGFFITHQRLLIQADVPERLQGRTFGLLDTCTSWGLAIAFMSGGALTAIAATRELMLATGVWELALAFAAVIALRSHWRRDDRGATVVVRGAEAALGSESRSNPALKAHLGQQQPHVIGGPALWLGLLDDLHESRHDARVELGAGVG
jgi:MFS family permease